MFVLYFIEVSNVHFDMKAIKHMGQVTELWLSNYLVLLSIDSKTR